MTDEQKILEKLRRVQALFAGTNMEGERAAAAAAAERLKQRLDELRRSDPQAEFKFTVNDQWSRRLLLALMRRHGLEPFRYRGQRYTTIMARVPKAFVDETLWPEYLQLSSVLVDYLEEVTSRLISEAVFADVSEAGERQELQAAK